MLNEASNYGSLAQMYFGGSGKVRKHVDTTHGAGNLTIGGEKVTVYDHKETSLRQRLRSNDDTFDDFVTCCLLHDPKTRPSAAQALNHPFLDTGRYSDGL